VEKEEGRPVCREGRYAPGNGLKPQLVSRQDSVKPGTPAVFLLTEEVFLEPSRNEGGRLFRHVDPEKL